MKVKQSQGENQMEKTFKVKNLEAFLVNLNDVTKKAIKLGFESPEYNVVEKIETSNHALVKLYEITVNYEIPYIKGWKVVAKREKSNAMVITHAFDNSDLSEYNLSNVVKCDHCGTSHRRKKSYVIKNLTTGNTMEVGHACLKDFTPVNPDALMKVCEFFLEDYNEEKGNGKYVYVYDLKRVLAITHAVVSINGYVSVKTSEERCGDVPPTKNIVLYHLDKGNIDLNEINYEYAGKIISYFNSLNESDYANNSYISNCIKLLKNDYVESDYIGYVVSTITVYHKANNEKNVGCYVGNIGEKISVKVKLVDRKIVNGYYGDSQFFKFVDSDNNNYVTFYSGCKYGENEVGKTFTLNGTLSKHESYKDVKNNVLKRISLK
jgi:hypothetical protein